MKKNSFQKQNTFIVKAEQIIDTFYSIKVIMKDGTIYEAQAPVKIDKQRPIIFSRRNQSPSERNGYRKC